MVYPTGNNANADSLINDGANFIRREMGIRGIPADTRNKRPIVERKRFENEDATEELYQQWTSGNMLDKDIVTFCGGVKHNKRKNGIYLNCIDLDNESAISEFCNIKGKQYTLDESAERGDIIIEQHADDKTKAHMCVSSKEPNLIYRLLIDGAFKNQRRSPSNND